MGFADAATIQFAVKGQQVFDKQPQTNVRTFLAGHKIGMALVVRADSNIQSLKDFKGKKIAVSSMGTWLPTQEALKKLGVQPSDYTLVLLPFAQQAEALQSKTADVAYQAALPRASSLIDLAQSIPDRFIAYDKATIDALVKDNPLCWSGIKKGLSQLL